MNTGPLISEYCERLDSGLWSEPANFVTNAAFFVAAWFAWRLARRRGVLSDHGVLWQLVWLLLIGFGSGLFHSFANRLTKVADIVPIGVFVLSFYGLWNRQILGLPLLSCAARYGALVVISVASLALLWSPMLRGPQGYFGILVCLFWLGLEQQQRFAQRPWLLYAAMFFAISLTFRTLDRPLCPWIPLGLHWLWHLFNAVVCYCALVGLIEAKATGLVARNRS